VAQQAELRHRALFRECLLLGEKPPFSTDIGQSCEMPQFAFSQVCNFKVVMGDKATSTRPECLQRASAAGTVLATGADPLKMFLLSQSIVEVIC